MKGYNLAERLDLISLDDLEEWMNENARHGQFEHIDPEDVLTGDPSEDANLLVAHLRIMVAERAAALPRSPAIAGAHEATDDGCAAPASCLDRIAGHEGASSGLMHRTRRIIKDWWTSVAGRPAQGASALGARHGPGL